jgi:hypothetical protein
MLVDQVDDMTDAADSLSMGIPFQLVILLKPGADCMTESIVCIRVVINNHTKTVGNLVLVQNLLEDMELLFPRVRSSRRRTQKSL